MTGLDRGSRVTVVSGFRAAGPVVRLLVSTQLAFNVGFFMVLPYLAVHLSDDLAQGSAVIGAVLGLRTVSQQGLFFVGGLLSDRIGVRPVVLLGCACRVVGFLGLGLSTGLVGICAGAALTGFAGALFSPAVEAALARAAVAPVSTATDRSPEPPDGARSARLGAFALFNAFGQMGTFLGPLVGAALLTVDFTAACLVGAALFVLIGCAHLRWLPRERPEPAARRTGDTGPVSGWREVLANRPFLAFAVVMSVQLIGYNQLYLLLPLQVERAWGSAAPLSVLFAAASLLVVFGQLPVTAAVAGLRPATCLAVGLTSMAAAFAVGAAGVAANLRGVAALVVLVGFILLFTVGQMIATPTARAVIPGFAGDRWLGAYYGFFASIAGLAVLPAVTATGLLSDLLPTTGFAAAAPWLLMSGAFALAVPPTLRRVSRPATIPSAGTTTNS
ncbi:MFS transporter [Nocardia sp. CC227C]|uniref:MFS transporter n=1 Tax=Nocardia sp. CC227C TaxID=3044562 RepID=UPI00278C5402|nr:MFS transporter [Nocardia sp. CC227C]